jgi:bifunctional non-homologous end joining protein LigD
MPGATVSTPLAWDEVNEKLDPSIYTMDAVLDRLDRDGDLYEGVLKTRQRLGPALRALES